jgi:hypothetical protein
MDDGEEILVLDCPCHLLDLLDVEQVFVAIPTFVSLEFAILMTDRVCVAALLVVEAAVIHPVSHASGVTVGLHILKGFVG